MSDSPLMAQIRTALERELTPTSIDIFDDSARHAGHVGAREGSHFKVSVVSVVFKGRPQLERHRLVYAAVAPLMSHGIHALNIVARTPEEVS